jgi:IrrE N-terminal-like domain
MSYSRRLLSMSSWPTAPLARVPGVLGAERLAGQIRGLDARATGSSGDQVDLDRLCEAARAQVRQSPLAAVRGGQQALLTPLRDDRFGIVVDPTPPGGWRPEESAHSQSALRRRRTRFRIAHELGHTVFYWRRPGERPRRHLPDSPHQERFCDNFARALLVPPQVAASLPVRPESVLTLQAVCDVSLEVAARALAAAHPDSFVAIWFASDETQTHACRQWTTHPNATISLRPVAGEKSMPALPGGRWLPSRRQYLCCLPEASHLCGMFTHRTGAAL